MYVLMIAASISKKQIGKVLLGAIAAVIVVVGAVYLIGKPKGGEDAATAIEGATAEQREAYLLSVGLQVDKTSSVAEVAIPQEFDERFETYNEMLKATNFDLSVLKGETVKKCTYTVTNREDLGVNISAVLLVHEGIIVAGHIIDNDSNRLYPLFEAAGEQPAESDTEETILPAQDVEEETGAPGDAEKPAEEPPLKEDSDETAGHPTE